METTKNAPRATGCEQRAKSGDVRGMPDMRVTWVGLDTGVGVKAGAKKGRKRA